MANCYRCGRPILDTKYRLRRRVRTGGFERRRFGSGRAHLVQAHYGMRVVCTRCARAIDLVELRLRLASDIQIIVALVALIVAILLANE